MAQPVNILFAGAKHSQEPYHRALSSPTPSHNTSTDAVANIRFSSIYVSHTECHVTSAFSVNCLRIVSSGGPSC
jgi:hypothetical protein